MRDFTFNSWKNILFLFVILLIIYFFIYKFITSSNKLSNYNKYKLELSKLPILSDTLNKGELKYGGVIPVNNQNFPVLTTFTSYYVEIFDESMRAIHLHNADELGYIFEGAIEIFIWLDNKIHTKTFCSAGNCYYIPKGSLHSLNNVSKEKAKLYIAFNSPEPSNIDIGIVLNGLPIYLKNAYSGSPHSLLKDYVGSNINYFFTDYPKNELDINVSKSSQFVFNIKDQDPDYFDENTGIIKYVNKYNWDIISGINMSLATITLLPNVSTDCFWYSNVDSLYCIISGEGEIYMMLSGYDNYDEKNKVDIKTFEEFFVPKVTPHVIKNTSKTQNLYMVVFFSDDNAQYVSLGSSLNFFTNKMIQEQLIAPNIRPPTLQNTKTIKNINRLIKV